MSDTRVSRSSVMKLSGVEGDLIVEDGGVVEGLATGGLIEVVGEVRCEGDAEFRTSLSCADFHAEGGRVEIQGDLSSRGEVRVEDGELDVSGSIQTREVDVDKRLKVGKDLKAKAETLMWEESSKAMATCISRLSTWAEYARFEGTVTARASILEAY